jgi:formiminotetrahydrofolate cyclodeaminase
MVERAQASKLAYLPVASFIQHTASRAPTPGGGAVAALNGSLGVGLLLMVCRLTLGKRRFAHLEPVMRQRVDALMPLRDELKELVDRDAAAFDQVMEAYGLPRDTEQDQQARQAALAQGYHQATVVPLEVMRLCLEGLEQGPGIAAEGSDSALSDCAVAALSLHTGFVGAVYNVRINLAELPAGDLRSRAEEALQTWPERAEALAAQIRDTVDKRMVS